MIEAEWWDYEDAEELAEAVAGDVGFIIESALDARGQCLIALPGGQTPLPIYEKLAKARIDWKKVMIVPTDDRIVAMTDPLSNAAMLARIFLPKGARVIPFISDKAPDHKAAGRAADARLQELPWPPDLVWLGMGNDGHTASIFAGPDLDEALDAPKARRAVGVLPDPLPAEAPVARVTLTRAAILSARTLTVVVTGKDKKKLLERAIKDGAGSPLPIGRVLADAEQAIDIHWCA
ncbi:MAG: 6-phosphogluconolactonase [Rhizorhabdus sp.]|uniref:6-phosphogluconolactonase n=1 Tax=Rhizorhabdus sp. TaxID=1968843 RepID=UPI001B60E59F|nr:6-phosphogluconolactonase [Rhizorhabdus sp.]MBP8234624.1 6-phosphogluconolactonase [Rhizorhabdus sp.]